MSVVKFGLSGFSDHQRRRQVHFGQSPQSNPPEKASLEKASAEASQPKPASGQPAEKSEAEKAKGKRKLWSRLGLGGLAAAGAALTGANLYHHYTLPKVGTFDTPQVLVDKGFKVDIQDGKMTAVKDDVTLVDAYPDNVLEKIQLSSVDDVLVKAKMGKIKKAVLDTSSGYPMYGFELKNPYNTIMLLPKPTDDKENTRLVKGLNELNIYPAAPTEDSPILALGVRLLSTLLYLGMTMLMLVAVMKYIQGGAMTDMKGKLVKDMPDVSLDDVQGIDEVKEEIQEVVNYLVNPDDNPTGAKMPRGILLTGPPGNGKTLIAKAVAAEAKVPFFNVTGSDFVEIFAGRGASRVRELFKQAEANAPCVVFIDEIDTVGQKRGGGFGGSHQEQEQTLNQLLTQLDGFFKTKGVVVIGATNRPELLDEALMSRLNKQITVMRPQTNAQREAILKVHLKKKPVSANVDLNELAEMSSGFSGRNLADWVEEASRLANRRIRHYLKNFEQKKGGEPDETNQANPGNTLKNRATQWLKKSDVLKDALAEKAITEEDLKLQQADFITAWQNTLIGLGKPMEHYDQASLDRIKVHEGLGHAWLCDLLGVPMHIVSSQPRGQTGGVVAIDQSAFSPMMPTKKDMLTQLLIILGGKAAEEVLYQEEEVSIGAVNDLEKATDLVRGMISQYGLFPKEFGILVDRVNPKTGESNFSPEKQREVEVLAKAIVDHAYEKVKGVIAPLPESTRNQLIQQLTQTPVVSGRKQTQALFDPTKASLAEQGISVEALKNSLKAFLKAPVPVKTA